MEKNIVEITTGLLSLILSLPRLVISREFVSGFSPSPRKNQLSPKLLIITIHPTMASGEFLFHIPLLCLVHQLTFFRFFIFYFLKFILVLKQTNQTENKIIIGFCVSCFLVGQFYFWEKKKKLIFHCVCVFMDIVWFCKTSI